MRLRAWRAVWLAALCAVPAPAGSLRVDPVQVVISDDRRTAAVTITNQEKAPVTVHAYPLAWSQSNGEDVYFETSEVIVSPRVVTIPPGGTQIVRVGFRTFSAAGGAWRLVVEEVPRPREEGGVQVALRLNLPLFARLDSGRPADLRWSAWRRPEGGWTLEAFNPGSGYVRLEPADFAASTGIRHEPSVRLGVVLPNGRRRWTLRAGPPLVDAVQFQRITRTEGGDDRMALASSRN